MRQIIRPGLLIPFWLAACASIVGERNQLVEVNSKPDDAEITAVDDKIDMDMATGNKVNRDNEASSHGDGSLHIALLSDVPATARGLRAPIRSICGPGSDVVLARHCR